MNDDKVEEDLCIGMYVSRKDETCGGARRGLGSAKPAPFQKKKNQARRRIKIIKKLRLVFSKTGAFHFIGSQDGRELINH